MYINGFKLTEMYTPEPLVSEFSFVMVEIAIEKFKRYTLLGIDEIQIELIQA
jgi:hypothetical protein